MTRLPYIGGGDPDAIDVRRLQCAGNLRNTDVLHCCVGSLRNTDVMRCCAGNPHNTDALRCCVGERRALRETRCGEYGLGGVSQRG